MVKRRISSGQAMLGGFGINIFTENDFMAIHYGTLEVLEKTGVFVDNPEAIDLYESGGARVDRSNKKVKIPASLVDECLHSAPKKVLLAGRDAKNDILLEGTRVHFCSFGIGLNVYDPFTGAYRKSTKKDVGDVARLCDYLEDIDMLECTLTPNDVHPNVYNLHILEANLRNTTKPCLSDPDPGLFPWILEMASAVAGGEDKLRERPIISGIVCPQSPMTFHHSCCEGIMQYARHELPMIVLPMAMAGGTSPVTLAGTVISHNVEVLAGLVLAQIVHKGAPIIYGSSTTMLDLKTATATVGCPELAMLNAALAKMAQFYLLPSWVAGG